MKCIRLAVALLSFTVLTAPAAPVDLAKIDRKIAKEPTYRAKPKYCLLVFGPNAKTRVWLVHDGDALHVDRNGNGDLTDKGERVAVRKGASDPADGVYSFDAGELREGANTHANLSVQVVHVEHLASVFPQVKDLLTRTPKARRYSVSLDVQVPGWKGDGEGGRVKQHATLDGDGFLQFADRPSEAPVIHFGGPWCVTLGEPHRLVVGRERELRLVVGTPGLGAGTTAQVGYEDVVPKTAVPRVEITYPRGRDGRSAIRQLLDVQDRC